MGYILLAISLILFIVLIIMVTVDLISEWREFKNAKVNANIEEGNTKEYNNGGNEND